MEEVPPTLHDKLFGRRYTTESRWSLASRLTTTRCTSSSQVRAFVAGDGGNKARQVVISLMPQGSLLDKDFMNVYVDTLNGINIDSVTREVASGLAPALLHRSFRAWVRSKWTSAEQAIQDQGLVEVCNGLLVVAFEEWADLQAEQKAGGPGEYRAALSDRAPMPMLEDAGCDDERGAENGGGEAGDIHYDPFDREKQTKQYREPSKFLTMDKPSSHFSCIALRMTISPLQKMQRKQFDLSSKGYTKELRKEALRQSRSDAPGVLVPR